MIAETRIRPHPKHSGAVLKKEKMPASGARNQSRSEAGELDVVGRTEHSLLCSIVEGRILRELNDNGWNKIPAALTPFMSY